MFLCCYLYNTEEKEINLSYRHHHEKGQVSRGKKNFMASLGLIACNYWLGALLHCNMHLIQHCHHVGMKVWGKVGSICMGQNP